MRSRARGGCVRVRSRAPFRVAAAHCCSISRAWGACASLVRVRALACRAAGLTRAHMGAPA
eukprot:6006092-Prymnesium_polylepis.1